MRLTLALAALVGCTAEEATVHPDLPVQTQGSSSLATDAAIQNFLASGAEFGVLVDPATGETATLQNLERTVNSGDFVELGAVCTDCGDPICATGPQRSVSVSLERTTGSGPVGISYTSAPNFMPVAETCNGAACPDPSVDAGAGPVPFDVDIVGNLSACAAFGVYFDTEDTTPPTLAPLQNATATFSQSISGSWTASEMIDGNLSGTNGWAIASLFGVQTAVFETVADTPAYGTGTEVTVQIQHTYTSLPGHMLGCFELSVTDADRTQFADGLQTGGDIGAAAIWTPLAIFDVTSTNAAQNPAIAGNRVVMVDSDNSNLATYVVRGDTSLTGITGLRLDSCLDPLLVPSLGHTGPGTASNTNFVVNELTFATRAQ
ncbi:MAG: hypothetical protein H6737_02430 [Alphaproteobacteria bacterium]|nr:hypothetical protein [Alphaproteobacteria bacterium]